MKGAVAVRAMDGYIPQLEINGGYFTSKKDGAGMIVYVIDKTSDSSYDYASNVSITGGYFDMNNYTVSRYVVDGYEVTDNTGDNSGSYPYTVTAIQAESGAIGYGYATIDESGNVTSTLMGTYTDVAGALYRANLQMTADGVYGYVQLSATEDGKLETGITIPKGYKIILDLNGVAINISTVAIQVSEGAELIIVDGSSAGSATVTSSVKTAGTIRNAGGTLKIYGGTYTNTDTENKYSPVIYSAVAYGATSTENVTATTIIYGGTFNGNAASDSAGRIIHLNLGTSVIYGGNFNTPVLGYRSEGTSIAVYGGYFTSDPSDYMAENYASVAISEGAYNYTVFNVVLGTSVDDMAEITATSVNGYGTEKLYVGVSASSISTYSENNYPTTSLTFTDDEGETHGYIFAGWYSAADETAYCTSVPETDAYAKFVDEDVLSVQVGVALATDSDAGYYWRFATGLDTLNFNSAGFEAYLGSSETALELSEIDYYTYYTVTSQNYTFSGSDFGSCGKYIATALYNSSEIPSECKIRAYWITLDGTTVYSKYESLKYTSGSYLLSSSEGE